VATEPRHAAVLGSPIAHSLSPTLHRAAYAALRLDWTYEAIECDEAALPGVLAAHAGWAGFSCTMPLKRAVLDVADEVSPLAAAVGAGNTLVPVPGGRWRADNTDVAGIVATVRSGGASARTATVLGAGGTAQAVVAALVQLGIPACTALVRDPARTAELRRAAVALGATLAVDTLRIDATALAADLVVSTLPGAAADPFAAYPWRPNQTVLDVVYDPWPTALAAGSAARGARVLSGARMLLHQAAEQVWLMTGRPAPLDAMRMALSSARPDAGV
jgi:shikimate dehydrogenase